MPILLIEQLMTISAESFSAVDCRVSVRCCQ